MTNKKFLSFIQPINGSVVISINFAAKSIIPIVAMSIPYTSEYRAGRKTITGNVGIANAYAGKE